MDPHPGGNNERGNSAGERGRDFSPSSPLDALGSETFLPVPSSFSPLLLLLRLVLLSLAGSFGITSSLCVSIFFSLFF